MNGLELVLLFTHFQTYLESVPLSNLSLCSQIHTVSQVEPCWGLFWSVCVFRAHPSYSPCVSTDELKARLQVKQRTAVVAGIVWDIWFTLLSMFWIHLTSEYYYFLVYANQLFGSAREYDLKSGSIRFNFKLAIQAFGSAWSDLFCVARLD